MEISKDLNGGKKKRWIVPSAPRSSRSAVWQLGGLFGVPRLEGAGGLTVDGDSLRSECSRSCKSNVYLMACVVALFGLNALPTLTIYKFSQRRIDSEAII